MIRSAEASKGDRTRLLAQIHIARKDMRIDEDAYRQLLVTETGQNSCAGLSVPQLLVVLQRLRRSGWSPKRKSPASSQKPVHSLTDKIRAVWINMARAGIVNDGSEDALDTWVKHQTTKRNNGIGIDRVAWLERDAKLAVMVLESLKRWQTRVLTDWQNADLRLVALEQARLDLPQSEVVRLLLDARRIFYWPLFDDLDVAPPADYLQDRRLLRHE